MENFFTVHAVAVSGEEYELDSRSFLPYDIRSVQSRFHYVPYAFTLLVGSAQRRATT
jgi:hypothetical protein